MDQLPEKVNIHRLDIALNDTELELTGVVYHVNQLVPYPLSAVQIEDWARSLNCFYPNLDMDILKNIIREMKLGKIDWDHRKGIQNICEALTERRIFDEETLKNMNRTESESSFARPLPNNHY